MQIDFGEKIVTIDGQKVKIHVFGAKLCYSRRVFAKAYWAETQSAWLNGIECAFKYFGGICATIVCDNASSLVRDHYASKPENRFTEPFYNFCNYYHTKPMATAVRKPRSKGKVESAVKYIKRNALVNVTHPSLEALNVWLESWCRQTDGRTLSTIFAGPYTPAKRFLREKRHLRKNHLPSIARLFKEARRVGKDGLIRVQNRYYRLPDACAGKEVQVLIDDQTITVTRAGETIAKLDKTTDAFNPIPQALSTEEPKEAAAQRALDRLIKDEDWLRYQACGSTLCANTAKYDLVVGWQGAATS